MSSTVLQSRVDQLEVMVTRLLQEDASQLISSQPANRDVGPLRPSVVQPTPPQASVGSPVSGMLSSTRRMIAMATSASISAGVKSTAVGAQAAESSTKADDSRAAVPTPTMELSPPSVEAPVSAPSLAALAKPRKPGAEMSRRVMVKEEQSTPPFIIFPDNPWRMRWDIMMLVLVLYYGVMVPLKIAFYNAPELESAFLKFIDDASYVLFSIDICLNFRTAIKYKGTMCTDWKKIGKDYVGVLRGSAPWFLIDVVATLPFEAMLNSGETGTKGGGLSKANTVLRLLRVFKLFRVLRAGRILKRFEDSIKFNPSVMRLITIFFLLAFYWHWFACIYWLIADLEDFGFREIRLEDGSNMTRRLPDAYARDGGNHWVPPPELWCRDRAVCNETEFEEFERTHGYNPLRGIDHCFEMGEQYPESYAYCPATLSLKYCNSLFWAIMISTGIGRDIMPVTTTEHLFSSIMIVLGVMMYAVIIGSASSALANLDSGNAERRQKLDSINQYMRQRHVPFDLQKRIREYYEYMWSSHQSLNEENGIMADLHHTLRLELHISLNRKLIQNIPMFQMITSSDCLIDLIEKLTPRIFIPGEYIVLEGEIGGEMYIIVRGTVHVLVGPERKLVSTLSESDVFGEMALMSRQRRNASIRAITYCDTLVLVKDDFDEVMLQYPEFNTSMQKISSKKVAGEGWDRVRQVLKMANTIRVFGGEVPMQDMLLGPPSQRTSASGDPSGKKDGSIIFSKSMGRLGSRKPSRKRRSLSGFAVGTARLGDSDSDGSRPNSPAILVPPPVSLPGSLPN